MKTALLVFMLLISMTPAFSQETGLNGRHVGPYGSGGNPYDQAGSGVAPILRKKDAVYQLPQSPPPLPARPVWETQPTTGHSLQYQQYQQTQPAQIFSPPATTPVQTPTYTPNPTSVYVPPVAPAAPVVSGPDWSSTVSEMAKILDYEAKPTPQALIPWYLSGAQLDANSFMVSGASDIELFIRHFLADSLVPIWNMTMQDNMMRMLMPLLLAIIIWKGTEAVFTRVMRAG